MIDLTTIPTERLALSDQILADYHGCGAYLVAYNVTDSRM